MLHLTCYLRYLRYRTMRGLGGLLLRQARGERAWNARVLGLLLLSSRKRSIRRLRSLEGSLSWCG